MGRQAVVGREDCAVAGVVNQGDVQILIAGNETDDAADGVLVTSVLDGSAYLCLRNLGLQSIFLYVFWLKG